MAEDPIALTRRGFDALAAGGIDAMLEYVHPEFEMETPSGLAAEPQKYQGREGLRLWFDQFYEVMDEVAVEPKDYEQVGELSVLIEFTIRARGQRTGIETHQEAAAIATQRDDLLAKLEFFATEDEARAALAER